MEESPNFGDLLRRHRVRAGLTQEELAERAGISARTISDLERGVSRAPRRDTLGLLVQALGLAPSERDELREVLRRSRQLGRDFTGDTPFVVGRDGAPPAGAAPQDVAPIVSSDSLGCGPPDPVSPPFSLRIHLLGRFQIVSGDRHIEAEVWRLRKARNLVKVLALAPRHQLPRDEVVEIFWPELEARAAVNSLHQTLHAARRVLDPDAPLASHYLQIQGDMLALSPVHPVWIDVEAFEAAAQQARVRDDAGMYRAALDLYTGDLLPEDPYEEWLGARREGLRQEYIRLLLGLARISMARRDDQTAMDMLQLVLSVDPAHEEAHAGLMQLHARGGHRHEAVRQYQLLQDVLRRDLNSAPQAATRALYEEILAGRAPQSVRQRESSAVTVRESRPEGRERPPTNLPAPVNSFIGRVREQAEIRRLLVRAPTEGGCRLVTLTGVGGCGKTRLALQVAADLTAERGQGVYGDGIWLVELAALDQSRLVPHALIAALGVVEQQGRPVEQTLAEHLHARRCLLVLDNCEHLIGACAALAETLLRSCPQLRLLCTSREPLRIPGEVTWQVPSLALPDLQRLPLPDELATNEAVRLFCERARAVLPSFALSAENTRAVAHICYRLDGLPLAIELAAARIKVLSLEQIVDRLEDCFHLLTGGSRTALSRQQTLRATLDWSHDLLTSVEQTFFRRLSVFAADGFDLEAAEAVTVGGEIEGPDVLNFLAQLADRSLVLLAGSSGTARYRLLEPVRQYARHALTASSEAMTMHRRHRDWYLALAEEADEHLWTAEQGAWLRRLEGEYGNVRAALDWCLRMEGEATCGLRFLQALWQFWLLRGHFTEGRRWFDDMLSVASAMAPARPAALLGAAALDARQGDLVSALAKVGKARSLFAAVGDQRGALHAIQINGIISLLQFEYPQAQALFEEGALLAGALGGSAEQGLFSHLLGVVAWAQGDYLRAQQLMDESLRQLRAVADDPRVTFSFFTLGIMGWDSGDRTINLRLEETLALFRVLGTRVAIGYILANLGNLARASGDYAAARRLLEESLALFGMLHDGAGIAQVKGQLGNLATEVGEYGIAHSLLHESLLLRTAMGDRRAIIRARANLGHLALARNDLLAARASYKDAMDLAQEMADSPSSAWLHVDLGYLALRAGDFGGAHVHFEAVFTTFQQIGHVKRGMALSRSYLGAVARQQGDPLRARAYFEESLAMCQSVGDRRSSAQLLRLLGEVAQEVGDSLLAQERFAASLALFRELGDAPGNTATRRLEGLAVTPFTGSDRSGK